MIYPPAGFVTAIELLCALSHIWVMLPATAQAHLMDHCYRHESPGNSIETKGCPEIDNIINPTEHFMLWSHVSVPALIKAASFIPHP